MKITVLLAEYSKIQHLTSERVLRKAGYILLNASDGEEALDLARKNTPDIVLLDMFLPRLRGREVMRSLKQDPATAHIPILIFSGLSQANEAKLKRDGAAGYFEKSRLMRNVADGEKELIGLIEEIVDKSRKRGGQDKQNHAHNTVTGMDKASVQNTLQKTTG